MQQAPAGLVEEGPICPIKLVMVAVRMVIKIYQVGKRGICPSQWAAGWGAVTIHPWQEAVSGRYQVVQLAPDTMVEVVVCSNEGNMSEEAWRE
jgi:hypothetical protein